MYTFTNEQFEKVMQAFKFLPGGEAFKALTKAEQDIIVNAEVEMLEAIHRKKHSNAKIAEYVAKKRKTDKNFARPLKSR